MKTQPHYNWFIEPRGDVARSNEMIAKSLPNETEGSHKRCSDGRDHYLWSCTFDEAKKLYDSQQSMQIDVKIWCQEGSGEIKRHTYLLKKPSVIAKGIKKQVAKMVARRKACLSNSK